MTRRKVTQLKDLMTRDVEVTSPEANIAEAARKMDQLNAGPLPVCDGRRLVGMVTDRDITVRERAHTRHTRRTHVGYAWLAQVS